MPEIPELDPLLPALRDLLAWWAATATPGMVIGATAASLLGRPRTTTDLDALVLVEPDAWPDFLAQGARFGLVPRISDSLKFARRHRLLLLRHQPSALNVDISLGNLPIEKEAIARASRVRLGGISVPLPTPEDLIIMKAVANRPQDLADIASVLAAHPALDLRRVRRKVREFARAMDQPRILEDLKSVLARRRKLKRTR